MLRFVPGPCGRIATAKDFGLPREANPGRKSGKPIYADFHELMNPTATLLS